MADLIIQWGAYAFRKALIIQRCRDSSMLRCETVDNFINLSGTHSDTDVLCYFIENRCVKISTFADHFDLCRGLEDRSWWDDLPAVCVKLYFFIDGHMAFFVFFATAAPAWFVSFHDRISSFFLLWSVKWVSCGLLSQSISYQEVGKMYTQFDLFSVGKKRRRMTFFDKKVI